LGAVVAAVTLFVACSSDSSATNPTADPFMGSYVLSTVGGASLPRHLDTIPATGAYDVILSGTLSFPDRGHVVVSSTKNMYDTVTAPAVQVSRTDTFTLGRLPTQAFLIDPRSPGDTVASIIVPGANQLALNYHVVNSIGTYLFVRH
jgi:hypothetical protein